VGAVREDAEYLAGQSAGTIYHKEDYHIHAPRHFTNEEVASGYSRCEMSAVESARWLEMTDSKHRKAELLTTTSPRITPCVGLILLTETTVALALALNRCRQVQEEAKV
jgi:hypothetical protein